MSTKILDHIVHLTPPGSIAETIESWEKLGFKVTPGGTHADGLTENALVTLSDTTYLELISFTHEPTYYPPGSNDRAARDRHAWAGKAPGWIDFALLGFGTSNPASNPPNLSPASHSGKEALAVKEVDLADVINARAAREGSGTVYAPTVNGGRTRPDGQELRWRITAPDAHRHGRGVLPFFCGDVTQRGIRVPVSDTSIAHPNTSRSVAYLRLRAPAAVYPDIAKQITSVVGGPPTATSSSESTWELQTPKLADVVLDGSGSKQDVPAPKLVLSSKDPHSDAADSGPGVSEIAFWVEKGHEKEDETPYGKIIWLAVD